MPPKAAKEPNTAENDRLNLKNRPQITAKMSVKERSSVKAGTVAWWCPHRPMPVLKMLRPKLVSPHLVLIPRFSFDQGGKFAVSRSPWLVPKEDATDEDILRYFVAVLNSSVIAWQIMQTSHKYSRGYAMLEKKTLKSLFVPKPKDVEPAIMKKLLNFVEKRLGDQNVDVIEAQIDEIVAQLYGLSDEDRQQIGLETKS
jgi:hypothetical protein